MIRSYPNYYDQTQSIGINGIIEWHGIGVDTPYPLTMSMSKSLEYGISVSKSLEYGISITKALEYGISITKSGGGA